MTKDTHTTFDLEALLASWSPAALDPVQWQSVAGEVHELIRRLKPVNRTAAATHLSALSVFLEQMRGSGTATLDLLTADSIERFGANRRLHEPGRNATTKTQMRRLHKLLAVKDGADPRPARTRPRIAAANPYSDQEMNVLTQLARTASARDGRTLAILIALVEQHGCPRQHVLTARIGDQTLVMGDVQVELNPGDGLLAIDDAGGIALTQRDLARARDLATGRGVPLLLHRLRHRWLQRVTSQDKPLAQIIARHGLTGDDLALALTMSRVVAGVGCECTRSRSKHSSLPSASATGNGDPT